MRFTPADFASDQSKEIPLAGPSSKSASRAANFWVDC